MKTIDQIKTEVGAWSLKNFGVQKSKSACQTVEHPEGGPMLIQPVLGSLAPLLGIGEELGELVMAGADSDLQEDAVADIMVYSCDYAEREDIAHMPFGARAMPIEVQDQHKEALEGMWLFYGKLLHATLKNHQGIRGFDDCNFYKEQRDQALNGLLHYLCGYVGNYLPGKTPIMLLNETWNKVVSKRDWTEDAKTGGDEHTPEFDDNGAPVRRDQYTSNIPPEETEKDKEDE